MKGKGKGGRHFLDGSLGVLSPLAEGGTLGELARLRMKGNRDCRKKKVLERSGAGGESPHPARKKEP